MLQLILGGARSGKSRLAEFELSGLASSRAGSLPQGNAINGGSEPAREGGGCLTTHFWMNPCSN